MIQTENTVRLSWPEIAVKMYPDDNTLKNLVALCWEFQRAAGKAPFRLSVSTVARLLDIQPTKPNLLDINSCLFLLTVDGIIKIVTKGKGNQATQYHYIADMNN